MRSNLKKYKTDYKKDTSVDWYPLQMIMYEIVDILQYLVA